MLKPIELKVSISCECVVVFPSFIFPVQNIPPDTQTIPDIISVRTSPNASIFSTKKGESNIMIPPVLGDKDSCFVMLEPEQKEEKQPSVKDTSSSESSETAEVYKHFPIF